jgi:hypothetical protein
MPGLFCKIRQGQRMYLVDSDSEGSGALSVQKGLDTWTNKGLIKNALREDKSFGGHVISHHRGH